MVKLRHNQSLAVNYPVSMPTACQGSLPRARPRRRPAATQATPCPEPGHLAQGPAKLHRAEMRALLPAGASASRITWAWGRGQDARGGVSSIRSRGTEGGGVAVPPREPGLLAGHAPGLLAGRSLPSPFTPAWLRPWGR